MRPVFRFAMPLAGVLLLGLLATGQPGNPNVIETAPLSPADEVKQFQLPPGFVAQLVAAEPDIDKPMNLAFDDRGRLWVTCSVEYPYPSRAENPRDRIVILEDFGPDGKARKATTFTTGLNIPIGLLPLPGTKNPAGLVHSIPSILSVRDTNGDGRADERSIAIKGFGSDDTHGMTSAFTLGVDGWVYACHGYRNTSKVEGSTPPAVTMNSGNTYRFRPDASRVEQFTWGQVNPFGLAFDPRGYLYSADCHSRPVYQLIRGAYYPSFGKPHDGLGFAPEMCKHDHGSTAICGVVYYDADQFPAEYRDRLYIGNVITNRINFDRVAWHGTSPVAEARPDFLISKDPWFRPVDIKLGPDGALYVADFYNCIIGHYEVPLNHPKRDRHRGRIWRIIYTGEEAKSAVDPRPNASGAKSVDLVADLAHPNLTVRMRATNLLAGRKGDDATGRLQDLLLGKEKAGDSWSAAHAAWVLERRGELTDGLLAKCVGHELEAVRTQTGRLLAEREKLTDGNRKQVHALLADRSPHVQRAATEAAARHPGADHLRPLLDLRATVPDLDTHLLHATRIALRNQLLDGAVWDKLGRLDAKDAAAIADVALGVRSPEAAAFLVRVLPTLKLEGPRLLESIRHAVRYGTPEMVEKLVAWAKADQPADRLRQAALFKAVEKGAQERGQPVPAVARTWAADLVPGLLATKDGRAIQAAGEIIGSQRLTEVATKLQGLVTSLETPEGARSAAVSALLALDLNRYVGLVGKVVGDTRLPIEQRERVAEALARVNLPVSRTQLVAAFASAPARLQTTIAAALASSKPGADTLLRSVEAGKASPRLLREKAVEVKLQQVNIPRWQDRVAKLTRGIPPADQKVQELIALRVKEYSNAKANAEKGKVIFTKHCANCHQIGGEGAKIGPQLDGLGVRGVERILEDTLDPNRNIDAAFRVTVLNLKNGQVVSGLVLREEGAVLVLADNQGKEVRVARGDVEERATATLSPMPANLLDQIPEADYYNLLAYLLAQRPKE